MDNMGMNQMEVTPSENKKKRFVREANFHWMQIIWLIGCLAMFGLMALPFVKSVGVEEESYSSYYLILIGSPSKLGWGMTLFRFLPLWNFFCTITSIVGTATGIRKYAVQRVFWIIQAPIMFLLTTASILEIWGKVSESYIAGYVKLGFGPKMIAIIGLLYLVFLVGCIILDIIAWKNKYDPDEAVRAAFVIVGVVVMIAFSLWIFIGFGKPKTKEGNSSDRYSYGDTYDYENDKKDDEPVKDETEKQDEDSQKESEANSEVAIEIGSDVASISSVSDLQATAKAETDTILDALKASFKKVNANKDSEVNAFYKETQEELKSYFKKLLEIEKQGYTILEKNFDVNKYYDCQDELEAFKDTLIEELDRGKEGVDAMLNELQDKNTSFDTIDPYWDAWNEMNDGYWDDWNSISDGYWDLYNKFSDIYWAN